MNTDDLISELTSRVEPVRVLPPPATRFLRWSALAVVSAVAAVAVFGMRPHLPDVLREPDFIATALLAFGTAALAGAAALVLVIPGAERSPVLRAATATLAIVWTIVAIAAVIRTGHGLSGAADWPICFVRVMAIAAVPGFVLFRMVRAAAPLRLSWTSALATTAPLATGALAIQFVCPIDNPAHALLGHVGPVLVIGLVGVLMARRLLRVPGL